ncbi:MAG: hypothetical protein Q9167_002507 [Letrouitia subvulpina]
MSSMRNVVRRRNHKERSQPAGRERWGLLEKHSDYSLRAKDYQQKKNKLRALRQKANERNPDEFHYGMMSGKTNRDGHKISDRGNPVLSQETVHLLKTQDAGYLQTLSQQSRRAKEKLEQQYLLRDDAIIELPRYADSIRTDHVIFHNEPVQAETSENGGATDSGANKDLHRALEDLHSRSEGNKSNTSISKANLDSLICRTVQQNVSNDHRRSLNRNQKRQQKIRQSKLDALELRQKTILAAERELELQRARMKNSVGGVNQAGVKWKVRERKK